MDVVVHTSLREGLARALPQAMLCGKPVVSFDVDGAREVVETDVTGILVPPGDLPRLQAALLRAIRDPAWRQACGLRGRERCRQLFPHDRMTARIRELYLQLAGR
jgi:glycosyltransferase involved in cell wall biosynthesis